MMFSKNPIAQASVWNLMNFYYIYMPRRFHVSVIVILFLPLQHRWRNKIKNFGIRTDRSVLYVYTVRNIIVFVNYSYYNYYYCRPSRDGRAYNVYIRAIVVRT